MIPPLVLLLASLLLRLWSALVRPTHAACPQGYWVNGIRPSGITDCIEVPGPDTADTDCGKQGRCSGNGPALARLPLAIHCPSGRIAVVTKAPREVGCR